jgi:hypothetical protein
MSSTKTNQTSRIKLHSSPLTPQATTTEELNKALTVLEYRQTEAGLFEEDGKHYGFKNEWFHVDREIVSTLIDRYSEFLPLEEAAGGTAEALADIREAIHSLKVILAEMDALKG